MSAIPEAPLNNTCEEVEYRITIKDRIRNTGQIIGWFIQGILVSLSLSIIRWVARDSRTVAHAKREFEIMYAGLPPEEMDGPNTWIRDNIIDLLAVLSTQGHSGGSIGYCLSMFKQAGLQKPLTQIKDIPETWTDEHTFVREDGTQVWQSRRMSSLFKNVHPDGTITYNDIDAVLYQDEGTDCYYTKGGRDPNCVVTMPYSPPEKPKLIIVPKESTGE